MSERFTITFKDEKSYTTYKQEVIDAGGSIVHDFGNLLLGFTASMPPSLVQTFRTRRSSSFADSGITTFDADSTVTIQPMPANESH